MIPARSLLPLLPIVAACGLNPARLPDHRLAVDDGDVLEAPRRLEFAVVGNTAGAVPHPTRGTVADALVADLGQYRDDLSFIVHMGDMVPSSRPGAWRAFDLLWRDMLDGQTSPRVEGRRVPVVPVVGEKDGKGDRLLQGLEGSFPGVGAEIGYQRVASWYAFDVVVGGAKWRFVVLDTNRTALGLKWKEQLYWIPRAVGGDDYEHLVLFMHHPVVTLAQGRTPDVEAAASELIEAVEDSTEFLKIRAVFAGDPATTEVFMEGGRFGHLQFTAGGGGAPADSLARWGRVGGEVLKLEPIFDLAVLRAFDDVAEERAFPEAALDAARAEGAWEGFPGVFDARYLPLYGWWRVGLRPDGMEAIYRFQDAQGGARDIYRVDFDPRDGWRIGS